ncbi:hypothetical protein Esti_004456 [Eimeria stiedai]
MDQILNCNIKFKHAAEVGRRAVVYCRGPDLFKWVYDNREMLNKKHSAALEKQIETEEDAAALCDRLIRFGFFYRAQYRPLDGVVEVGENGRCKRPKWPKRLAISQKQSFDVNSFYCCVYEGNNVWQHFMLFCVIAAVLCVCMFPAWPLQLKIGLWYISVVFLTILLFLIVLRLILFLLLWFVGYQFWLLPNLFNEDAGFIDSFIPLTEFQKTPGSWTMVGARAFCALLSAATVYKLGETHSPSDVATFARQSFIDVLDWGRMRLEAPYLDANKALPSAAAPAEGEEGEEHQQEEGARVSGDEEDYRCLGPCGYKSFEDLMVSKCLVKCHCMQELVDSECFPKCPDTTRAAMDEARGDACREEEARRQRKQRK